MSEWILLSVFVGLFFILVGFTIPKIGEELGYSRDWWRNRHADPIDWTDEHNLKLPLSPYFDPRLEFTEEEAFIDLIEENIELLKELEKMEELQAELARQERLKKRYLKALNRAKH